MFGRSQATSAGAWEEFLRHFSETLHQVRTLPLLFECVYEQLPTVLGVDRVSLLLYHKDLNCLANEIFFGYEDKGSQQPPRFGLQKLSESISGRCFGEASPILIGDCRTSDLIPAEIVKEQNLKSTLAVPVMNGTRPLGVLRVDDTRSTNRFDMDDAARLTELGRIMGEDIARLWPRARLAQTQLALKAAYDQLQERVVTRTTELAAANQQLRASEERFRGLAETALDAMVTADARGLVVYVNPAAEKLFGYTAAELLGQPVAILIPERLRATNRRGIRRILPVVYTQRGTAAGSLAARRRNGTEIPVECSFSSWRAEGRLFVTGIVRDVTERRRSETVTRTFTDLGYSLSVAQSSREVARAVLDAAQTLIGWESSYADLVDEEQQKRSSLISFDKIDGRTNEVAGTPHSEIGPLARKTLTEGAQLVLRSADYQADPRFLFGDQNRPSLSMMFAPIQHGHQNVGLLSVQSYALGAYTESDLDLFAALANFCSGALQRTAAEERLRQSEEALLQETAYVHLLGSIAAAANNTNRLTDVLASCLEQICLVTGWELGQGLVVAEDSAQRQLLPAGRWHASHIESWSRFCASVEELPSNRMGRFPGEALLGSPIWVDDLSQRTELALAVLAREAGLKGAMAVPVLLGKEVVAVLLFFSTGVMHPSGRLLEVMHHVGVQLGRVVERSRAEERLTHEAFHDALTGLPNRACLMERLERCIARGKRQDGRRFGVLFLDLDRFKVINDSLGHTAGDEFLTAVARKLELCVRESDTVARLGGDEFVLLLEDVTDVTDCTRVAERVAQALSVPITMSGHSVISTASIGIVLGPEDGHDSPIDIMRDADAAMYRAKAAGKACYQLFDPDMHAHAVQRLRLEADLRRGLEAGEIVPYYQPVVNLTSGRILGFEALARWIHPERGLVSPAEFIPVAEETGLVAQLGWQIMRQACRWMHQTHGDTRDGIRVSVSVNVAAIQLRQPDFVEQVRRILEESGLNPLQLRLEITESSLLSKDRSLVDLFEQIRALDVQLQVDDFGTGYCSLSYLHWFPVDALKIDRSFINNLTTAGQEGTEIVRAIVALARSLGLNVIAEGVETETQMSMLVELGCEMAQGFLFSRAVDSESALRLGPGFPVRSRTST